MEQAGKVATSTIEAMKASPPLLAVLLLQLATLVALYFVSSRNAANQQAREMMMLERCLDKTDGVPPL